MAQTGSAVRPRSARQGLRLGTTESVGAGQLWVHSCDMIGCGLVGTNCVEWGTTKLLPLLTAIAFPLGTISTVSRYNLNSDHTAYTGCKHGWQHVLN